MIPRSRSISSAALVLTAALALVGCSGDGSQDGARQADGGKPATAASASPEADGGFDVAKAVADGGRTPLSAKVHLTTEVSGATMLTMSGRMNVNTELSGELTLRMLEGTPQATVVKEVFADGAAYVGVVKGTGAAGGWQKVPSGSSQAPAANLNGYVGLLLDQGPEARKGMETTGGVRAYRLSGRIATDELRDIDPSVYGNLRTADVDDFACDLWVDEQGRVVRFEQWVQTAQGKGHNTMTLTDFAGPVRVEAPAVG